MRHVCVFPGSPPVVKSSGLFIVGFTGDGPLYLALGFDNGRYYEIGPKGLVDRVDAEEMAFIDRARKQGIELLCGPLAYDSCGLRTESIREAAYREAIEETGQLDMKIYWDVSTGYHIRNHIHPGGGLQDKHVCQALAVARCADLSPCNEHSSAAFLPKAELDELPMFYQPRIILEAMHAYISLHSDALQAGLPVPAFGFSVESPSILTARLPSEIREGYSTFISSCSFF